MNRRRSRSAEETTSGPGGSRAFGARVRDRRIAPAVLVLALLAAGCGAPDPSVPGDPPAASDALPPPEPAAGAATAESPTRDRVRARGRLNCGVNDGLPGFAFRDNRGQWRGFEVDFCRAVAAAVLGDARAVSITGLTHRTRFAALQSGAVDVLARGTAHTFLHDASTRLDFAGISYYDGQGFLVRRRRNLQGAAQLAGARICVQAGANSQVNLSDYFRVNEIGYRAVLKDTLNEAREAYAREECDALSADVSALAASRSLMNNPAEHVVLPDIISKEPLGLMVREGDPAWGDIVRWTLNVMILGEEYGLGQQSVDTARRDSASPDVRRLLGAEGEYGRRLGLNDDWAYRVLRQVGSYDEVFNRNIGPDTALQLDRGRNALWNALNPGLLYGLPVR